jgi:hypothetical protein
MRPSQITAEIQNLKRRAAQSANLKTINGTSILGVGDITVSGDPDSLSNTYSNSLTSAISAIGSTETTLLVDADTSLTVNAIVPSTLKIDQRNAAAITLSGVGSIKFSGKGVDENAVGLFVTSAKSRVQFTSTNSINTGTDVVGVTHGMTTGEQLRYIVETGSAPGGLTANGIYYAINNGASSLKLASSYANALAGTAINITSQGSGVHSVVSAPVAWSSEAPDHVLSDIFDTSNSSESDRVSLCTEALSGLSTWIKVNPRTITKQVTINDGHSLLFLGGTHGSNYTQATSDDRGAYHVGSNCEVTSVRGAIIKESSVNFNTRIISTKNGAQNVRIHHNYFQGQSAIFDGSDAGVLIDNGNNCHIEWNIFDNCQSYCCSITNAGSAAGTTSHCSIRNNYIYAANTQVLFIGDGEFCDIVDNVVNLKDYDVAVDSTYVVIDIEPNKGTDRVKNVRIEGNRIDTRGTIDSGVRRFIKINPADTAGCEHIYIRNNHLYGNYSTGSQSNSVYEAILVVGTDQFEVSGNHIYGVANVGAAISIQKSIRGKVSDNTIYNGSTGIILSSCVGIRVWDNRYIDVETGVANVAEISEAAVNLTPLVLISGTQLTLANPIYGADGYPGNMFEKLDGVRGYLNDVQYEIDSITQGVFGGTSGGTDTTKINLTSAPASGPTAPISVLSASGVDHTTDKFTSTAHGFVTGAAVQYGIAAASTVCTDLNGDAVYYIIRVDADHFKLATSYANAQAGTVAAFSSNGTGTQKFYPMFTIYSYDNEFRSNSLPITLATHSNSRDITPSLPTVSTVDTSSTADETDSGITFENTGATTLSTVTLPSDAGIGKQFSAAVTDAKGIKFFTPDCYIQDGTILSPQHGFTSSVSVGSTITLKRITSSTWFAVAKQGTWSTPILAGATLINAIDCGRTAGGTVAGWEQDTLFTGGAGTTYSAYTADVSNCSTPANNDVYQTARIRSGGTVAYDWTGRDSAKSHLVRLHIIDGYEFSNPVGGTNLFDISVNSATVQNDYDPVLDVGVQVVRILEYFIPSGTTTVNVTLTCPDGSHSSLISAIELYKLA